MTAAEYFEQMYASSSDPWHLAERPYEQRKYEVTVASLPRGRYRRAFEPGCSIGLLTALLAPRCDELIATDTVAAPLATARAAVPSEHVTFAEATVPDAWPAGELDLVVLSEILYFLSAEDRAGVLARVLESLSPDGHLVLVHWRHPFAEAACTGDHAHAEVAAASGLVTLVQHLEDDFRLEVLGRG
ncbi:SAM-dependent methyltransferase [Aeromicrobium alkaliterrae]|uniref:SAM-dependent methyltransferase n=1 Tax=Aeromicrobium alkaliterrae TaxID=302168 RepID=A0ABP4W8X2_9ACTN